MSDNIRRALAVGAITAIGFAGTISSATAAETPAGCDPVVLGAAIDAATADAHAAQDAYTAYTRTSVKVLTKQVQVKEAREATAASRQADKLAEQAAKAADPEGRKEAEAAARAAKVKAHLEAKESARVQRAGDADLRAIVKANRVQLKATWTAAKVALHALQDQQEQCNASPEPATGPSGGDTTGGTTGGDTTGAGTGGSTGSMDAPA